MGDTAKGSFFDYSSISGSREWQRLMQEGIFRNNISGIWIDNNEFGTLVDDDEELKGDVALWSMPQLPSEIVDERSREAREDAEVSQRFGWGRKPISVGAVGRGVLTMGMARATYDALCVSLRLQSTIVHSLQLKIECLSLSRGNIPIHVLSS